jgi:hypothetical protein
MKNSFLTFSLLICFGLFTLKSTASINEHGKSDSLSCLKIEGKIINNDRTEEACIIELIDSYNHIDTILLKEGKTKFKFVLNKDSYYAIRISKAGYISKVVSVNTEILTDVNGIYRFEFETSLLQEAVLKKLNQDALDFPVAIVYFDHEKDCFSYNKEYSAFIKKELHTSKPKTYNSPKKEPFIQPSAEAFASASR